MASSVGSAEPWFRKTFSTARQELEYALRRSWGSTSEEIGRWAPPVVGGLCHRFWRAPLQFLAARGPPRAPYSFTLVNFVLGRPLWAPRDDHLRARDGSGGFLRAELGPIDAWRNDGELTGATPASLAPPLVAGRFKFLVHTGVERERQGGKRENIYFLFFLQVGPACKWHMHRGAKMSK